jgi:hypothetical protein
LFTDANRIRAGLHVVDNPMTWPIDVFYDALSDLNRFALESAGEWNKVSMQCGMDREKVARRLRRAGIPPLFI